MSIRESIEKNKGLTTTVFALLIAACITWIVYRQIEESKPQLTTVTQNFFTSDGGETFFAADASNVPPTQIEGQDSVLAHVFEVGGERKVLYLERFTPEGRQNYVNFLERREAAQKELENFVPDENTAFEDYPVVPTINGAPPGRELKAVGGGDWVPARSDAGRKIVSDASARGKKVRP
ncbi:MAG: hypothetical protein AAGI46_11210 [Planctomycetota bacterium]